MVHYWQTTEHKHVRSAMETDTQVINSQNIQYSIKPFVSKITNHVTIGNFGITDLCDLG